MSLKKTAVAILALSSSLSFAGTMGPVCTPGNVTVPCEQSAWDLGVQALYLKPSYDADAGYAGFYTNGTHRQWNEIDTDWGWGFKVEGSYHFNTGNDVNLNWYHFDDTTHAVHNINTFVQPYNINLRTKARWDAVNLEMAQHVDFGDYTNVRFHGGLQYARIRNDAYTNLPASNLLLGVPFPVATLVPQAYFATNAKFDGIGPRVGADTSYDMKNGFSLYANTALALLVGTSDFNALLTVAPGTPATAGTFTASASKNHVVPEVEAKIGGKYSHAMAQGNLTVDAGWMFVNYFNAQHAIGVAGGLAAPGLGAVIFETDFAVNGPYVGLHWVGNA
jgi:Legionella pneumophila major outer membrane protein precursor